MEILEHFESMWTSKVIRKTSTIPAITYNSKKNTGTLNNDTWYFNVPYAFRDALDLKFEERRKNKKSYMVWTQGPILHFKSGDLFIAQNEDSALQVLYSNPMGWDSTKEKMYLGSVTFKYFTIKNNKYIEINQHSCNQIEFLTRLIVGTTIN